MPAYFSAFLIGLLLLSPVPIAAAVPTHISVTGTGTVSLPPDEATVTGTIETYDGHNASTAVGQNADLYDRVAAAVVAAGVARADITLSSYNVSYNPPPNDRSGFTVYRSFRITVRAIGRAGNVVDAATGAGATQIGVSFGLHDSSIATERALQRAVADATARATAIASAAHLHVIGIAQISAGYVQIPQPMPVMAMAVRAPTTFDNGNTTVTQTVSVEFLAKP